MATSSIQPQVSVENSCHAALNLLPRIGRHPMLADFVDAELSYCCLGDMEWIDQPCEHLTVLRLDANVIAMDWTQMVDGLLASDEAGGVRLWRIQAARVVAATSPMHLQSPSHLNHSSNVFLEPIWHAEASKPQVRCAKHATQNTPLCYALWFISLVQVRHECMPDHPMLSWISQGYITHPHLLQMTAIFKFLESHMSPNFPMQSERFGVLCHSLKLMKT